MERRFILAKAGSTLRECMGWEDVDDLRAIIVEREGRIVGFIPPRSGIWRESVSNPDRPVDDFVEKQLVVCRDVDLLERRAGAPQAPPRGRGDRLPRGRVGRAPPMSSASSPSARSPTR